MCIICVETKEEHELSGRPIATDLWNRYTICIAVDSVCLLFTWFLRLTVFDVYVYLFWPYVNKHFAFDLIKTL